MSKKCAECGVPMEGFMAKVMSLFGVRPSTKNPEVCNKCEDKANAPAENPIESPIVTPPAPPAPEMKPPEVTPEEELEDPLNPKL